MNQNKFTAAMGFSARAGKCAAGEVACENAVSRGKARLVLIDKEASNNTKERWRSICSGKDVMLIETEKLGIAIGKPGRMVAAILDTGFSDMIIDAYQSQQN